MTINDVFTTASRSQRTLVVMYGNPATGDTHDADRGVPTQRAGQWFMQGSAVPTNKVVAVQDADTDATLWRVAR